MVDRSTINEKAIVIMDRGYESYNVMAHIQEKGWFYLIRVKDFGKHKTGIIDGLELPNAEEFNECIDLNLTRKQTNEMKTLFKMKNKYRRIAHNKHLIIYLQQVKSLTRLYCTICHLELYVSLYQMILMK